LVEDDRRFDRAIAERTRDRQGAFTERSRLVRRRPRVEHARQLAKGASVGGAIIGRARLGFELLEDPLRAQVRSRAQAPVRLDESLLDAA
jgi:hypothetical protein